jgi:hypothetical protein
MSVVRIHYLLITSTTISDPTIKSNNDVVESKIKDNYNGKNEKIRKNKFSG